MDIQRNCDRITYSLDKQLVKDGIDTIFDEAKKL